MHWIAGEQIEQFDLTGLMRLVKTTQANKSSWADKSFDKRAELCSEALKLIEANLDQLIETEANYLKSSVTDLKVEVLKTLEFVKNHIKTADDSNLYARGVFLALLPKTYGLSTFIYMTILGSLYANSMIIKLSTAGKLIELFQECELANYISVLQKTDDEAFEMLLSHPFMDSIIYMGTRERFNKLELSDKKVFASFDAINTHIVLKNANINQAAAEIAKSLKFLNGLSLTKPHRVLVAQAVMDEFKAQLKTQLADYKWELPEAYRSQYDEQIESLKKDVHNVFLDKPGIYITSDLTYCSTFQETEVLGGFLSLSDFKYNYEAAKWVNVSARNRQVSVWTTEAEKAEKLISKIHAPKVLINKSEPGQALFPVISSGNGVYAGMSAGDLAPQALFAQKRITESA